MAMKQKTKRTVNTIIGKIKGKEKKTDLERENEIKQQVAEQTDRIRNIQSILKVIDFSNSELPKEELEKKSSPEQSLSDYELTRKMAVKYLEEAKATEMDNSRIDECIRYAANAFAEGVEYGQIHKAKWSSVTLMYLIQYGRVDVLETDRENAEEMKKKKEEHAEKYITILKECKKLDNRERRKAKLNKEYQKCAKELEEKRKKFNEQKDTDEGAEALEELNTNAHHPIKLSVLASTLDGMLDEMSRKDLEILSLKGELRELNHEISLLHSQMDSLSLALVSEAYVEDKDLQSRIEEINVQRRKEVAQIVSENERLDNALREHQSAMLEILDASSSAKATARNLLYLEKKEQEEKEKEARLEAIRAKRRAEKERRVAELKKRREEDQHEKELDKMLDELTEEDEEMYENAYAEEHVDEMEQEEYHYYED